MSRHLPGTIWTLHKPQWNGVWSYVRTMDKSNVMLVLDVTAVRQITSTSHITLAMSRGEARLLARRIQQMLEATK